MNLFSETKSKDYFDNLLKIVKNEIEKLSDEEIINCGIEEWKEYYLDKYIKDIIEIQQAVDIIAVNNEKIKKSNYSTSSTPNLSEYYWTDGYIITIKINFTGERQLLKLIPSTRIVRKFMVEDIKYNLENEIWELYFKLLYKKEELDNKSDLKEFVLNDFTNNFKDYISMIEYLNKDILDYNNSLEYKIIDLLEVRKNKAINFQNIKKKLEIPLELKENIPNLNPIPLQKRKKIKKPNSKDQSSKLEYYISNNDYTNIMNIIHLTCSSMETTAKTFAKNSEEELRDFIIATLDTHYTQQVSGETFRKIGKTDIQVIFENKAAFIAECKIWHGIKQFEAAINQVLGYSTWKDNKISIILFNKKNKDFKGILESVEKWIKDNTRSFSREKLNFWKCVLYLEEKNIEINISIQIYDLYC